MPAKRPHHANSLLGPAPAQTVTDREQINLLTRVRGYWRRGKAWDVMRALLGHLGSDGRLFPSYETIAESAKVCARTAERWINSFCRAGFLAKILRRDPWGQTSNGYLVLDPDAQTEPQPPCQPLSKVSLYNSQEDKNGTRLSIDSLPPPQPRESRPGGFRRVGNWIRNDGPRIRPEPKPPERTVEEQILLLTG